MTTQDWISLAFFLAWCGVAFCEGALFGLWLADRHCWRANRDGSKEQGAKCNEPEETADER